MAMPACSAGAGVSDVRRMRSTVVADAHREAPTVLGPSLHCAAVAHRRIGSVRSRCDPGNAAFVALIGPPGAGKTTVARAFARRHEVSVFRLREAVRAYSDLLADLPASDDPLGWLDMEAVRRTLHAAFVKGRFAFSDVVLLDNFPGTAAQLRLLAEVSAPVGGRLTLLELRASRDTVRRRVAERRTCPCCGPDPHAPATVSTADPARCGACGAALDQRESDHPARYRLRRSRYLENLPEITAVAAELGVAHVSISADGPAAEVSRNADEALSALVEATASTSGARTERSGMWLPPYQHPR